MHDDKFKLGQEFVSRVTGNDGAPELPVLGANVGGTCPVIDDEGTVAGERACRCDATCSASNRLNTLLRYYLLG
jgi:hypothetical protein